MNTETPPPLTLEQMISNHLHTGDFHALSELVDVAASKCMDFCREFRAVAQSHCDFVKLYPDSVIEKRKQFEAFRLQKIAEVIKEKQAHD